MKLKYFTSTILFIFVIMFLSCEKNADNIDYPDYTPRLVIHSYISPSDTVLTVNVSTTTNVFGNPKGYPKVLPVKVNLVDGETIIPFSERDTSGNCFLKYDIVAGKEYKIIAQCPGYPEITSKCRVPEIKNFDISIDTFSATNNWEWGSETFTKLRAKFTDIPNEVNYYDICAVETDSSTTKYSYFIYLAGAGNSGINKKNVVSDHLIDGQPIFTSFIFYKNDYSFSQVIDIYLLATDVDYYNYDTSLSNYKGGDDPFTEFSPVYSNINGGYGIFCSYIQYKKTFKIK